MTVNVRRLVLDGRSLFALLLRSATVDGPMAAARRPRWIASPLLTRCLAAAVAPLLDGRLRPSLPICVGCLCSLTLSSSLDGLVSAKSLFNRQTLLDRLVAAIEQSSSDTDGRMAANNRKTSG